MSRLDFDTKNLPADLGASITMALVAVPDAIASAILAGVNPTFGFNALIVGTPIGSLFTSSQFMNLTMIGVTLSLIMHVILLQYSVRKRPLPVTVADRQYQYNLNKWWMRE